VPSSVSILDRSHYSFSNTFNDRRSCRGEESRRKTRFYATEGERRGGGTRWSRGRCILEVFQVARSRYKSRPGAAKCNYARAPNARFNEKATETLAEIASPYVISLGSRCKKLPPWIAPSGRPERISVPRSVSFLRLIISDRVSFFLSYFYCIILSLSSDVQRSSDVAVRVKLG